MARAHLVRDDVGLRTYGDGHLLFDKIDEHDVGMDSVEGRIDSLERGTTSSVVTIHPADGMATGNVADLAAFPVANDGLTLTAGKRVLLPLQSTGSQNGIYVVGAVAGGVAPLTRAPDFNEAAEVKPNALVAVSGGTVGANRIYQLTVAAPPTIGTTSLTFARLYNADQAAAAGGIVAKREQRIQHSDLTSAVNGEAQEINIGAGLPENAVVLAHDVDIGTLFSGGGATAVKLDIGGTTATAITSQADVFTGAATGKLSLATGSHVRGHFGGEQLKAKFTPDAGHSLDGLTAGDLTITIWFAALP